MQEEKMKIAVIGAGAIGGVLAVRFALSGQTVTVVDQGAHLEAIQGNGLKLIRPDGAKELRRGSGGAANARTVRRKHHRGSDPERSPVVVLSEFQRPARGLPAQ